MGFLLADTSMKIILGMSFLLLSNANIEFAKKLEKFIWKTYTTIKTLSFTSQIKLINKKKFTKVVLYKNSETYIIYMIALNILKATIYLSCAAQMALLYWDKALTKIPIKYFDYIDVFCSTWQ